MINYIPVFLILLFYCCSTVSNANNNKTVPEPVINVDAAEQIALEIIKNKEKLPNKQIAVLEFTDIEGNSYIGGKLLSERVITKLVKDPEIKIIERAKLDIVLKEQEVALSGITEEDSAQKVGKILNTDAVVSGNIAVLDGKNEISARLIDTNSGQIISAINIIEKQEIEQKESENISKNEAGILREKQQEFINQRKDDPELFNLNNLHKKYLLKIKNENEILFREILKTGYILKKLIVNRPRIFLLVTEPADSLKIKRLKIRKPDEFQKLEEFRQHLKFVADNDPLLYKILKKERIKLLKELKEED